MPTKKIIIEIKTKKMKRMNAFIGKGVISTNQAQSRGGVSTG
jgi:hypothetical protein